MSRRGEPAGPLWVVAEGLLETSRTWANGRRILLSLLAPGDTTDLAAAFDDQPTLCDILTRTHATLVNVPRCALQAAVDRPESQALSMLRALSRQGRIDAERLHMDLINSPRVRLARTLLRLAAGVEATARGRALDITQDDLAAMLGLSRQSIASAMKPLVRAGLVETGYRCIMLRDLPRLIEVANEEEPPPLRAMAPRLN